jgi:hypothetical protein
MLIKEVTAAYKLNKLNIKKDDPRYPLYTDVIRKYSRSSKYLSNLLHKLYRDPSIKLNNISKQDAQMLDDIMFNHSLNQNMTLYYGVKESPSRIWVKYNVSMDQPVTVHFPGFISTSIHDVIAIGHSRKDSSTLAHEKYVGKLNVLVIEVPAGTPGLNIENISRYPEEDEILLARGLDIKIYPNPKLDSFNKALLWSAEVVGHTPQEITE